MIGPPMVAFLSNLSLPGRPALPPPDLGRLHRRWPDNLSLRQRRPDDTADLFALFSQDDFQRNGSTLDPFTSIEDAEALLRLGVPGSFEIVALLDTAIVGYAGVHPLSGRQRHTGTVSLCVHEGFQGRGIGTALLACLVTTARVMMGLSRLQLTVFVDNARALALYRRLGFVTEGRITNFVQRSDGFIDAYLMAWLTPAP